MAPSGFVWVCRLSIFEHVFFEPYNTNSDFLEYEIKRLPVHFLDVQLRFDKLSDRAGG